MPIDLNERLSEYSYGYGVTREVEDALRAVGMRPVPFLPNLIHEAKLGFDVAFSLDDAFDRPGTALMLQFKLGQSLQRFVRKPPLLIKPSLRRPFWRFNIDTAEPDGQYELLLKAEQDGAQVYYAVPRFTDWSHYLQIFKSAQVVETSLLIRPSDIQQQLVGSGQPDGNHRIVYDPYGVYVCSNPAEIPEVDRDFMIQEISVQAQKHSHLGDVVERLFEGLGRRREIRREVQPPKTSEADQYYRSDERFSPGPLRREIAGERPSERYLEQRRDLALAQFRERGGSENAAKAAVVATEAWASGAQMILVTPE